MLDELPEPSLPSGEVGSGGTFEMEQKFTTLLPRDETDEKEFFLDKLIGCETSGLPTRPLGERLRDMEPLEVMDVVSLSPRTPAAEIGIVGFRCVLVRVLSSSPLKASRSLLPSASTASISSRSCFTDWECSPAVSSGDGVFLIISRMPRAENAEGGAFCRFELRTDPSFWRES